ncbi:peptidoglycan-binding protein [Candidatus Entotheonella serta]|nr:peptidoglycan-binding protein [Candidatus Entotheonella serta]
MVEAVNPTPTLADDVAVNDLPVLRLFSRGASVKILQTMLNQNGNQLVVVSISGSGTLAAVTAFQQAKGLRVDCVVGSGTWSALHG